MRVFLGIPFRDDGGRQHIYDALLPHITDGYAFDWVETVDSGHTPFSRAATRNLIVRKALEVSADVVVINDADSLCDPQELKESISGCFQDGRVHIPFETVRVANSGYLRRNLHRPRAARWFHSYGPSCGGIYVIRPERWVVAGGQDERIKGWGYEDQCFIVTVNNLIGGYVTHPGNLYTFQHFRPDVETFQPKNTQIRDRYHHLDGNPIGIRKYQRGSNSFCP